MPIITDLEKTEIGVEGYMHCTLTDEDINVSLHGNVSEEYAERCAEALNHLSAGVVDEICNAAVRYFSHHRRHVGEEIDELMHVSVTELSEPREILKCIQVGVLIVDEPKDERIGYHVLCGCDWEEEHGLEFTILDGKLVYLGGFNASGAWGTYPPDNVWNYVNDIERKY